MADIKSPDARSKNMSEIRSKDTNPEVYLRKKLFHPGSLLIDTHSNQETLGANPLIFAGFHVDRIDNHKGIVSLQRSVLESVHNRVKFLA